MTNVLRHTLAGKRRRMNGLKKKRKGRAVNEVKKKKRPRCPCIHLYIRMSSATVRYEIQCSFFFFVTLNA